MDYFVRKVIRIQSCHIATYCTRKQFYSKFSFRSLYNYQFIIGFFRVSFPSHLAASVLSDRINLSKRSLIYFPQVCVIVIVIVVWQRISLQIVSILFIHSTSFNNFVSVAEFLGDSGLFFYPNWRFTSFITSY